MNAQEVIDTFNRDNMVGTHVQYWTGAREGRGRFSTTRHTAHLLGGHTPVVWVAGEASCIALTHVEPVPHQPDDIDEYDDFMLPDAAQAAERVRAYVTEFGDGLYDVVGGAPLYGRDLEALCRAVLAATWSVPKVKHDEDVPVTPNIIGGWIYRSAGQSDAEHTRQYAAQLLAAADELDRQNTEAETTR